MVQNSRANRGAVREAAAVPAGKIASMHLHPFGAIAALLGEFRRQLSVYSGMSKSRIGLEVGFAIGQDKVQTHGNVTPQPCAKAIASSSRETSSAMMSISTTVSLDGAGLFAALVRIFSRRLCSLLRTGADARSAFPVSRIDRHRDVLADDARLAVTLR